MFDVAKFDQYQRDALRTMAFMNPKMDVLHCACGMAGEAGEVACLDHEERIERIKELGDCFWYAAVMGHVLEVEFSVIVAEAYHLRATQPPPLRLPETLLMISASKGLDVVKKAVFYEKDLNREAMRGPLVEYVRQLLALCDKASIAPEAVMDANIRKLRERYPTKFDADRAMNKDHLAEDRAAAVGGV